MDVVGIIRTERKKTTVIMAGSYNPPHLGHLAMLEYLADSYEEVIAVIGMNPEKVYSVSPAKRASILKQMIACIGLKDSVRVEVVTGYIWRYAVKQNAKILFRGIRSWSQDGKEETILHILNMWGPIVFGPLQWPLPTNFLEGKPEYQHISSSLIRDICKRYNGNKKNDHNAMVGTSNELTSLSELVLKEFVEPIAALYS